MSLLGLQRTFTNCSVRTAHDKKGKSSWAFGTKPYSFCAKEFHCALHKKTLMQFFLSKRKYLTSFYEAVLLIPWHLIMTNTIIHFFAIDHGSMLRPGWLAEKRGIMLSLIEEPPCFCHPKTCIFCFRQSQVNSCLPTPPPIKHHDGLYCSVQKKTKPFGFYGVFFAFFL